MPDVYTHVPKPTSSVYSFANPQGKQLYDQADVIYDDPTVFYDSVDTNAYIYVPKPANPFSIRRGMITGLLIPLTYNQTTQGLQTYTYVAKPTT